MFFGERTVHNPLMVGSDDIDPRGRTQHNDALVDPSATTSDVAASTAEVPQFAVGDVLNDTYELTEVLGSGGMGQVFAGHDRELNRNVAIKVCWKGFAGDVLTREAQVMAAFRHPGLIAVHALGRHASVPYLVMERLYGHTLAQQLARRSHPFTLAESLHILRGTADALTVLHGANLVHRDLKPENIMLVPPNRVVVLDFGIVQQERNVKSSGTVSGSPHFMAPESATSEMRSGDAHLVDIYALGVLAFRMITGELPYDAPTFTEVLVKQVRAPIPDILAMQPNIPEALAELITEMLAKDPSERPHSIDFVARRLARVHWQWHGLEDLSDFSVMIVDDDQDTRDLLEATVQEAVGTARVRVAPDGVAALRMFEEEPPDLMIVDLEMPGMNGLELCMSIAHATAAHRTKIAIVSAWINENDAKMFQVFGVTEFIRKEAGYTQRVAKLVVRAAIAASH